MENQLGGIKNLTHNNRRVDTITRLENEVKRLTAEVQDLRGCFDDIMALVRMSNDMQPSSQSSNSSAKTSDVSSAKPFGNEDSTKGFAGDDYLRVVDSNAPSTIRVVEKETFILVLPPSKDPTNNTIERGEETIFTELSLSTQDSIS